MPHTFSRISYRSSDALPSDAVRGLHPLLSCSMLLTECQVADLKAKRRGGPKKVWLEYALLDEAGKAMSMQVLCFKTISVKNFSNQANILQYKRNLFGSVRMESAPFSLAMVLSGGLSATGCVSKTVGVNIDGVQLESHPRFVLSTGKGNEGARTTLQWYGSNATCRIQLQNVWIEHKELRVTFEQNEGAPLLEFAPRYKTHYEARPSGTLDAAAGARVVEAKAVITTPKAAAVKEQSAPMATRTSRRLSALPPVIAPPAVAAALRKRQRDEQREEEASMPPLLESPVPQKDAMQDGPYEYPPALPAEESHKRRRDDSSAAAAAAQYSGLDLHVASVYDQDAMDHGSQPMLDVGDADPSAVGLGLEEDYSQPSTPDSTARTPSGATPFREGQEESAANADFSATSASERLSLSPVMEGESDELDQLRQMEEMQDTCNQAEAAHSKYERMQLDPFVTFHMPTQKRSVRYEEALPTPLATPSVSDRVTVQFQLAPQAAPSHLQSEAAMLPSAFASQYVPMSDALGLDLPRSPGMFGQMLPMSSSPLPYSALGFAPSSPMSPGFMLDCRAQRTPLQQPQLAAMDMSPLQRLTPIRAGSN